MTLDFLDTPALDRIGTLRRVAAGLREIGFQLLLVIFLLQLSVAPGAAAVKQSVWNDCRSQDLDLNISACTNIVEDSSISDADRITAFKLRAAAYLMQHSFISAGNDFTNILRLDPRNIAALGGRAVTNFRKGNRDQAVLDYSIAKRLDSRGFDAMVSVSDDLKEVATFAGQNPLSQIQLDAALAPLRPTCQVGSRLDDMTCVPIVCPAGQRLDGSNCLQIVCGTGFSLQGSICIPTSCPVGQRLDGARCSPIVCSMGYSLQGSTCLPITCPAGQRLDGNNCVSKWNSVAGGIWKVNGNVHVAIGYSGLRDSPEEAKASAEAFCRQSGRNCRATGAWNLGCVYITVGSNRNGAGWSSASTSDDAMQKCRSNGYSCKTPIGGCVN